MAIVAADVGKDKDTLFEVQWLPFQLNPNASTVGTSRMQYLYDRMGKERVMAMKPRFDMIGEECDINFSFSDKGKTGNTMQAHRLMSSVATDTVMQNKLSIELFKAVFEDDEDITNNDHLAAAARRAGMDFEAARAMLANPEIEPTPGQVAKEAQMFRMKYRVSGVPFFIIGNATFSGAQESAALVPILRRALGI